MVPDSLALDLRAVLLPRLQSATDYAAAARAIVDDLRQIGHPLRSWDESDDFAIWGDDYVNPPRSTRFAIDLRWPTADDAARAVDIEVTFGPWPK